MLDVDNSNMGAVLTGSLLEGTAEYDRWPTDDEFRSSWMTNPLYENLTRPRMRLILEAIEADMRTDKAESAAVPKSLTIEHILPQAWEEHWSEAVTDVTEIELRKRLVHAIGNLTLVNNKLNPALSNAPWDDVVLSDGKIVLDGKRGALAKHSTLFLNKDLAARSDWTDGAIDDRSEQLFACALKVWPRPSVEI
ncbi:MAG: hypothetical protein ACI9XZ_003499 [Alphaproteobacteria bacterium]|jgi:hypothetical protein